MRQCVQAVQNVQTVQVVRTRRDGQASIDGLKMAEIGRVSIRIPSAIKQGDVIRVRTLVIHPMELVQRDKQGKIIAKNYHFIQTMRASFNGKEILRTEITQAISQNPSFTFPLKADQPGKLTVTFSDTAGKSYESQAEIKFS
jgi:sulfur-oxidizing protein SoxZ